MLALLLCSRKILGTRNLKTFAAVQNVIGFAQNFHHKSKLLLDCIFWQLKGHITTSIYDRFSIGMIKRINNHKTFYFESPKYK